MSACVGFDVGIVDDVDVDVGVGWPANRVLERFGSFELRMCGAKWVIFLFYFIFYRIQLSFSSTDGVVLACKCIDTIL